MYQIDRRGVQNSFSRADPITVTPFRPCIVCRPNIKFKWFNTCVWRDWITNVNWKHYKCCRVYANQFETEYKCTLLWWTEESQEGRKQSLMGKGGKSPLERGKYAGMRIRPMAQPSKIRKLRANCELAQGSPPSNYFFNK